MSKFKIDIEDNLWSKFKAKCALEKVTMIKKITELITNYVKGK